MDKGDNMKYAVDEIIDKIALLENIETGQIKEVDLSLLPKNICEGNIIIEDNGYKIDKDLEKIRRERIQDKLNKLK